LFHGLHHRAEPGNRTATQVITVAKTAGYDDDIGIAERGILVPDKAGGMAKQAGGVDGVLVAVAGGELENREIHDIQNGNGPEAQRVNCISLLCAFGASGLFNFKAIIFDDRIAQKFVRGVIHGLVRGGLVGAGRKVNLDVFTDVDASDTGVTHLFKGFLNGFALRIKDGFFWCDDDFCFHARAGKFCGKNASEASQKVFPPDNATGCLRKFFRRTLTLWNKKPHTFGEAKVEL
jgi:hypothetical protein